MTRPNRPPAGGAPVQPWTPGSTPGGVTCPTCGLANEPGARVCRNCGLPVAAQNDPLRGVAAGSVEMPSAQRAGISATIGLGLVVIVLLAAGTLAVSGGGILDSGGRIGLAEEASPTPATADPDQVETGATGSTGEVVIDAQAASNKTDYSCQAGVIRDAGKGKWTIGAAGPSGIESADRLTFRFNRRAKGKAPQATVVKFEWMTPSEAIDTFGLNRVGGQRALVLTFEGPSRIANNTRLLASELEDAGATALRSVEILEGEDGDVHAVVGVRGEGCARLQAPKWGNKKTPDQTRMYLDVQREDAAAPA